AQRDLRRLDRQIARRVISAIERLAEGDPRSDVRKLSGADEYRLRAGEWRVRFQHNAGKNEILILRILPRGRAYER
ncbi:MAG: type II toxin-antitoxin system RelE family toxin, partial [Rhodanobacter sp.]